MSGCQEDTYTRVKRLMAEAKANKKEWSRPSSAFVSNVSRMTPTRTTPAGDAVYYPDRTTVTKTQKSGWGASLAPQRMPTRKCTDAMYHPKHLDEQHYATVGAPSVPATPRMPSSETNVPGVGTYTSPYVSCGMGFA